MSKIQKALIKKSTLIAAIQTTIWKMQIDDDVFAGTDDLTGPYDDCDCNFQAMSVTEQREELEQALSELQSFDDTEFILFDRFQLSKFIIED